MCRFRNPWATLEQYRLHLGLSREACPFSRAQLGVCEDGTRGVELCV